MYGGEKPRRPVRVIILVLAFWVIGGLLQTVFGLLVNETGLAPEGAEVWIGQILGWGLLFALSFRYREQIDTWLRRS